jgi:DNA-binding protein H-NS
LNAKISSEIRIVSDKIDNVSRDAENKVTTLNYTTESVRECMNERMNAHVVQARKETDRQRQEITAASSSLLGSIKERKEQVGITVENLNREISKSKEYVDSKFSTVSGEIQDIKQHSATEMSRLSATFGDLQAKLVTGISDSTSPAVPLKVDVRSDVLQQVDNTPGSNNTLPSVPGANGCSTSVCNDVNSVINQPTNQFI